MNYLFAFRRYRLAFRNPVRTAHGVWAERDGIYVRLTDEDGTARLGEASVIPWFGTETVDAAEDLGRALGETVNDEQLDAISSDFPCMKSAFRAARDATPRPAARSHLGVAALLPAGRGALRLAAEHAEVGFRSFKWKVGVADVADELSLLDDLCAALPEGAKLRLDANGAWDRRRAERWLERCAERPVEFVEQPIAADAAGAKDLLLGLSEDYPTPIALDESVQSEGDVERWLGEGWRGVFIIKPSLLGNVIAVCEALEAAQASVVFSSALETAIGARAALRVAFAFRGAPRALGFGVWPLFVDARADGPRLAPFLRAEDVEGIDVNDIWNATN